jgi:hypothetical protein
MPIPTEPIPKTLGSVLYKSRTLNWFSVLNSFLISNSVLLSHMTPSSLYGIDSQACSDFTSRKAFILFLVRRKSRHFNPAASCHEQLECTSFCTAWPYPVTQVWLNRGAHPETSRVTYGRTDKLHCSFVRHGPFDHTCWVCLITCMLHQFRNNWNELSALTYCC